MPLLVDSITPGLVVDSAPNPPMDSPLLRLLPPLLDFVPVVVVVEAAPVVVVAAVVVVKPDYYYYYYCYCND